MDFTKWTTWSYALGILIVLGSHVYILVAGLPENQIIIHAVVNLVAGFMLMAGWWYSRK